MSDAAAAVPSEERIRYLLVGAWNVALGYGLFLVLLALLSGPLRALGSSPNVLLALVGRGYYVVLSWVAWILAVPHHTLTIEYLAYRRRVGLLGQIRHAYAEFLPAQVLGTAILLLTVGLLRLSAPVGALVTIVVAAGFSYLGHTYFRFRGPLEVGEVPPEGFVGAYQISRLVSARWQWGVALVRDVLFLRRSIAAATPKGLKPYVVAAPDYRQASGGIKACHRLVHELNQRGMVAYVLGAVNPDWDERRITGRGYRILRAESDPIVVYPEIVSGNPLDAAHVVRWVLNTPGYLGGDSEYPETELVFAWSRRFYDTDRILTVDVIEHELFNTKDLPPRTLDCYYMGKAGRRGVHKIARTDGMTEITSHYPPTRRELAGLLRRTRTLYTYDDCTALAWEALLCGCRVILLPEEHEFTLDDVARDLPDTNFGPQLTRFIDETQSGWAT